MNETFICLDCFSVGDLDGHLRCATCESDSVVSALGRSLEEIQGIEQRVQGRGKRWA